MREILFRGECVETGDWINGFYVRLHDSRGHESHRVYSGYAETDCGDYYPDWWEVDPDTVGQFTGLTDKNGKRIFEGDICRIRDLLYKVEFKYSCWWFTILSSKVYCCPAFSSHCGDLCEIIGNIRDNPELLEGNNE